MSGKLRGKPKNLDLGNDDLTVGDPRREVAVADHVEAEESRPVIEAMFAGTALSRDADRLNQFLSTRSVIREEWGRAGKAFLAIGRALLQIEGLLTPEEYRRFRSECAKILPFSDANASKFRQIALAVEDRRIDERQLPGAFSSAYELSTLDRSVLAIAAARNLVRPDVGRNELLAFKRDMKAGRIVIEGMAESVERTVSLRGLQRERDRIRRELDRLADQQARLVRDLERVQAQIAEASGE
ncbi:hypothetical protein [Pseudoroseomonas sp. WGS1072]|uniref:hypothetical protein n=1 Tax=Roseomonas sp. WGS1072 TaxID=3366816 RepID=UPI003BF24D6D